MPDPRRQDRGKSSLATVVFDDIPQKYRSHLETLKGYIETVDTRSRTAEAKSTKAEQDIASTSVEGRVAIAQVWGVLYGIVAATVFSALTSAATALTMVWWVWSHAGAPQ